VIAAFGACGVRVDFDITCIDHQPFNAGRRSIVPAAFPTFLCHAGDRSADGYFSVALLRREITPGSPCAENPETRIDELSVIADAPSPCAGATREAGFEQ